MKKFNNKEEETESDINNRETNNIPNTENKIDTNNSDDTQNTAESNYNKELKSNKIKLSFFKKIKVSVVDFDKYYIIASESITRTLGYLLKIFILFSLIVSASVTYKIAENLENVCNDIESIPSFQLADDTFSVDSEEPIRIEKNDGYINIKIIMDNSEDSEQYVQELENYNGYAIALNKHNFTAKIAGEGVFSLDYEELKNYYENDLNITKENIIGILTNTNIYILVFIYIFIVFFLIYFISMLIDTLALSILGLIITRIVRLPLTYSSVLAIATASTTLPIILNLLYLLANIFLNFTMPQFQMMITLVSYIYLIAGILILRSNLIKNSNNTYVNDKKEEEKGT